LHSKNYKIIEIVQQITKKYEDANFKVHLAGSALFTIAKPECLMAKRSADFLLPVLAKCL
jgi:hypothetical protein